MTAAPMPMLLAADLLRMIRAHQAAAAARAAQQGN